MLLTACATYSDRIGRIETALISGHPDQALRLLDKNPGDSSDHVLYLLNRGMLLRLNGQFEESNTALEQAKGLIEELSAVSVSEQAGALAINDGVRAYVGDPHEQVMLHLFKAFNYIDLGQLDSARVEVLQVDIKLRQLAGDNEDSVYREDAFARYLSGLLFETLGDWNNALVSYRKAFKNYSGRYRKHFGVGVPSYLKVDLLRLTERQGLDQEVRLYSKAFGIKSWVKEADYRRQAHVVMVLSSGLAPIKREKAVNLRQVRNGQLHRIALPFYQSRPNLLTGMKLEVDGAAAQGVLVEDIEAIARQVLDEQLPGIQARALARAVIKNEAVDRTRKANGTLGALMNIATFVSERADTRSWSTLPARIYMARLDLEPGKYDLAAEFHRGGTSVERRSYGTLELKAGDVHFILEHRVVPGWARGGK